MDLDALESLLVSGDFDGAAEASAQLIQQHNDTQTGFTDAGNGCFRRLLFVALQSHFYTGRCVKLLFTPGHMHARMQ